MLIPLLLIVAVIGFVLGIRSPATPRTALGPKTRSAFVANLIVEYPSTWRPASAAVTVPGLALAHELVLAPGGRSARAGLMAGQIAGTAQAPLPASLLASLGGAPHTEVVQQPYLEAYRYRQLRLAGQPRTLELYVVPGAPEASEAQNATGVACYAEAGMTAYLRQCERIVAHISLSNPTGAGTLIDASYARHLDGVLAPLASERARLRAGLRSDGSRRAASQLAIALAQRLEAAAASIAPLQAPANASAAQSALATALTGAAASCRALAAGHQGAEAALGRAEAPLETALEGLAVLGYGPTEAHR